MGSSAPTSPHSAPNAANTDVTACAGVCERVGGIRDELRDATTCVSPTATESRAELDLRRSSVSNIHTESDSHVFHDDETTIPTQLQTGFATQMTSHPHVDSYTSSNSTIQPPLSPPTMIAMTPNTITSTITPTTTQTSITSTTTMVPDDTSVTARGPWSRIGARRRHNTAPYATLATPTSPSNQPPAPTTSNHMAHTALYDVGAHPMTHGVATGRTATCATRQSPIRRRQATHHNEPSSDWGIHHPYMRRASFHNITTPMSPPHPHVVPPAAEYATATAASATTASAVIDGRMDVDSYHEPGRMHGTIENSHEPMTATGTGNAAADVAFLLESEIKDLDEEYRNAYFRISRRHHQDDKDDFDEEYDDHYDDNEEDDEDSVFAYDPFASPSLGVEIDRQYAHHPHVVTDYTEHFDNYDKDDSWGRRRRFASFDTKLLSSTPNYTSSVQTTTAYGAAQYNQMHAKQQANSQYQFPHSFARRPPPHSVSSSMLSSLSNQGHAPNANSFGFPLRRGTASSLADGISSLSLAASTVPEEEKTSPSNEDMDDEVRRLGAQFVDNEVAGKVLDATSRQSIAHEKHQFANIHRTHIRQRSENFTTSLNGMPATGHYLQQTSQHMAQSPPHSGYMEPIYARRRSMFSHVSDINNGGNADLPPTYSYSHEKGNESMFTYSKPYSGRRHSLAYPEPFYHGASTHVAYPVLTSPISPNANQNALDGGTNQQRQPQQYHYHESESRGHVPQFSTNANHPSRVPQSPYHHEVSMMTPLSPANTNPFGTQQKRSHSPYHSQKQSPNTAVRRRASMAAYTTATSPHHVNLFVSQNRPSPIVTSWSTEMLSDKSQDNAVQRLRSPLRSNTMVGPRLMKNSKQATNPNDEIDGDGDGDNKQQNDVMITEDEHSNGTNSPLFAKAVPILAKSRKHALEDEKSSNSSSPNSSGIVSPLAPADHLSDFEYVSQTPSQADEKVGFVYNDVKDRLNSVLSGAYLEYQNPVTVKITMVSDSKSNKTPIGNIDPNMEISLSETLSNNVSKDEPSSLQYPNVEQPPVSKALSSDPSATSSSGSSFSPSYSLAYPPKPDSKASSSSVTELNESSFEFVVREIENNNDEDIGNLSDDDFFSSEQFDSSALPSRRGSFDAMGKVISNDAVNINQNEELGVRRNVIPSIVSSHDTGSNSNEDDEKISIELESTTTRPLGAAIRRKAAALSRINTRSTTGSRSERRSERSAAAEHAKKQLSRKSIPNTVKKEISSRIRSKELTIRQAAKLYHVSITSAYNYSHMRAGAAAAAEGGTDNTKGNASSASKNE